MSAYRLLLLLYPRGFRRRYGGEMEEVFERLVERTRDERGLTGVAALWVRTAADALVSGTAERLYGRTPDRGGEGTMRGMIFQVGQAMRRLRRAPGYAAAFVVTLGLAIGVNSAVFSVVNGVLLQPLPFQDGERILYLKQPVEGFGVDNARFSFMEIDDYRSASTTIDEFVEFGDWEFTIVPDDAEPHRAVGGLITSNYFGVLGMRPALGRLLNDQDDMRGAEPVMVLTDAYWERAFGRDPSIVGRVLNLENLSMADPFKPTRVVGVLEPGLHYTGSRRPDFYVNYAANDHYQDASMRDARGHRMTDVFARMAPGVTADVARTELGSIAGQIHREYPGDYPTELRYGLDVVPWEAELTREGRSTFLFLMGTVGIVLLLAAANVTNLTLTRLIRKEGELSTRAALGASATDLRLHLTAEHAVLGLAGGALGIVLAYASGDSLVAYASRFTVRAQEVGVDWTVLGATLGGGILLSCLLAWLPGLPVAPAVSRVASAQSKATDTRWRKQLQRGLVVSQLALSFTLLTGTGLLVRSLIELTSVDPGFRTEQIVTMRTPTGPAGTTMPGLPDPGWQNAIDEIRAFPGVRSAAVATWAPLSAIEPSAIGVQIDDQQAEADRTHLAAANSVSPEYFDLLGVPLLAGRYFDETDHAGSRDVVILNESMARAHFGDTDPTGHRIAFAPDFQHVFRFAWHEIVGVVADSKEYGMGREGVHTFYRPAARTTWGPAILVAHQGDANQLSQHVRDVIHRMQPDRAIEQVQTLASLVQQDVAPSRLNAVLFGSFAALALLIATLGVFATLAFSVSQRVREFGIRMAVGADHGSVLRSVLREGIAMVAVALVFGVAAALALGRFLAGLLFQVETTDPLSMVAAASVLGAVALTAALLPALRATRIHPSEALKGE